MEFDDDSVSNHVDITSSFFEYNHCYYENCWNKRRCNLGGVV